MLKIKEIFEPTISDDVKYIIIAYRKWYGSKARFRIKDGKLQIRGIDGWLFAAQVWSKSSVEAYILNGKRFPLSMFDPNWLEK